VAHLRGLTLPFSYRHDDPLNFTALLVVLPI
jgi:hypothetical protein